MKRVRNRIIGVLCLMLAVAPLASNAATEKQLYAGEQMKSLGILSGYEDGDLRLDNNITRAEIASIMVRTLEGSNNKPVNEEPNFSDVVEGNWATKFIKQAGAMGIISGYTDNTFKPSNNITFAEMMAIYLRSIDAEVNPEDKWPENYMNLAKEKKLLLEEEVDPNHKVTRGEVCEYLWRLLLIKY